MNTVNYKMDLLTSMLQEEVCIDQADLMSEAFFLLEESFYEKGQ